MRPFLLLALLSLPLRAHAAQSVSFLRSHNFQLSSAPTLRSWLGVPELSRDETFGFRALFAENRAVPGLYDDIKSKDANKIQNRLAQEFGQPLDAEAKVGFLYRWHKVEQTVAANAAAAMMVDDPVFPELSGILFNDFTLTTGYPLTLPAEIRLKPALQYGWRRTMDQSFSVGQLLDRQPNLKLSDYPYRFYSELNVAAERSLAFGVAGTSLTSLALGHHDYDYWKTELTFRTHDLLKPLNSSVLREGIVWAGFQPVFGGLYTWQRTIRLGVTLAWLRFLRTDLFLFDGFRPAAIIAARVAWFDLELFTMERSEDEHKTFNSRQYGLSLTARF